MKGKQRKGGNNKMRIESEKCCETLSFEPMKQEEGQVRCVRTEE
jgi:hypothetical protein